MTTEATNRAQRRFGAEKLAGSRILVVDDQPANLMALESVLDFAGYQNVECLSDSREVISAVNRCKPDLILLDLHMPHLDGMGVLDQLAQAVPEDDYLPVLILTGDGSSEAKENALAHGASDFLSKPLSVTEVALRVGSLLRTRSLHRQLTGQNVSLEQKVREGTELAEALSHANQQLRETQAHLVQSEKMGSLGQLVAGIAHEINNPLAFVLNNIFVVQNLLEKIQGNGEVLSTDSLLRLEKALNRMGDMQEGASRVADLVSTLRTFSRLDEGQFKTINIHESIESVLLFLRHKMAGRIEVIRQFEAPDMLSCFAGELNQVLMNLIANAIDAIPESGAITVATRHENGNFVARIRDTGRGIPKEIAHRIFEPFFTTKSLGQGTGLGLAVSYGIVKAHHGSIECASEIGQGSEFTLTIPLSFEPVSQS
jgi:two-component system NtrC family sensor kinase